MTCGSCGCERPVMIGMAPGRDGTPWALCFPCWRPAPKAIGRTPAPKPKRAAAPTPRGALL